MELLVLHDRKVMTCCAICIIPCLPYVTQLFHRPLLTYVEGKLNCVFPLCVQTPGHAVVCGGVLQIAFNGLQKTVGNLTLGCLGASEVIVEVADVCQLEPRARQQGYGRENIEALDKATGSVAGHRTRIRRGNGIKKRHGPGKWDGPQVKGGIEG